jgi:hypothetical protein
MSHRSLILPVSTFIAIELCLGLTAASLPDLRGLIARIRPGLMSKFRHAEDSSTSQHTNSRDRDPERQMAQTAEPAAGFSIGGGIRVGGEYGLGRRIRKPDWMRTTMTGSLWEDTRVSSRDTSRSRPTASRDSEAAGRGIVEELPHAGESTIVPELTESEERVKTLGYRDEGEVKDQSSDYGSCAM